MKKKIIITISALVTLMLLLPFAFGVSLSEAAGILSSSMYISFHNVKEEKTVLYVQKIVTLEDPESPAPEDDTFDFILKVNDEVVKNKQYTLLDAEGRYIYNYEDGQTTIEDPTKMEVALKTDDYGKFTLKDGQTALFDDLSPGDSYEITEEIYMPYTQIQPAADEPAVGTLTHEGSKVTFINEYPPIHHPVFEAVQFKVRKSISYPANYEVPETPDFTFKAEIQGFPLSYKEYTVHDIHSERQIGEGETDKDGQFTLKGETYALFTDIPGDVDYSVSELTQEGWNVVGGSEKEGATVGPITTVDFTNVLASFGVSKAMLGSETTDQAFTFQILNEEGKPDRQTFRYYLYNSALQLVDEDLHETKENGQFTLQAGQTAIFIGFEIGAKYGVREESSGEYVQYLPTSGQAYTNKPVRASVEVLPFINAKVPGKTLLTVRKTISDESVGKVPDVEFTFRISKLTDGEYVPAANVAYDITDAYGNRTYSTDENGEFKLKAWETVRFVELKEGDTYQVEEVADKMPAHFLIMSDEKQTAELGEELVALEFENKYDISADIPESGGSGTKWFYIIGCILVLGGGVLLAVRRKAGAEDSAE